MRELTIIDCLTLTCITDKPLDIKAFCKKFKKTFDLDDVVVYGSKIFECEKTFTTIIKVKITDIQRSRTGHAFDLLCRKNKDDVNLFYDAFCFRIDELHDVHVTSTKKFIRDNIRYVG